MQTQDSMKLEQPIEHRCRGSRIQASVLKQNADLQSGLLHLSTGRDVDCNQPTSFCLCCIMALHLSTGRDVDCNDIMAVELVVLDGIASLHGTRCGLQ